MAELNALTAIDPADVSDDDLVLIFDIAAPSSNSKKATRGQFLAGVVRTGANATLAVLDAAEVNAPVAALDTLTVATGLVIGATVSKVLTATASLAVPDILADASTTVTMTVTGASVGDVVLLGLPAGLSAGMIVRGDVTGANTVTVRLYNATTATIAAASYSVKAVAVRVT